ncbi:MAG: hypothetical protein K2I88_06115, partial [Anaeroplasmataceae bacterium]|nr:hypothetical protein [Anaeroplasmataceae bacterium]
MMFITEGCYKMFKISVCFIIVFLLLFLVGCDKKEYKEEHVHTKVHVLKIEPTCISEGRIEYWFCSQCNRAYRDKDATSEISWEETKLPKKEHDFVETSAIAPTCETAGITRGKYCSYCNMVIEEQKDLMALGHSFDYENADWQWEGFEAAKLVVSCSNSKDHKKTYVADVSSLTFPATCTEAGKTIYTATALVEQTEYTNQKEEILLPLEHNFDLENISWSWLEKTNVNAQIPCKNDPSHTLQCEAELHSETFPATCTTDGKVITTATVFIQGKNYEDVKEEKLLATGHAFDYDHIEWNWTEYDSATAKVTCINDKTHQVSYNAEMETKSELPTCTKAGRETHIATITVGGKTYTDEQVEIVEALNHDFNYEEYEWKWEGFTKAQLYFSCKNDPTHFDIYTAQIQKSSIPATCVSEGEVIYTANINLHEISYTDVKEEILPIDPKNHDYDYEHPQWIWQPVVNGYQASARINCKCNQSALTFDADPIEVDYKASTFVEEGFIKYQAEVMIEGKNYKDTKLDKLPIRQYVNTEEDFRYLTQKNAYDLTLTNDIHLQEGVILEGNYASIDLNGYTLSLSNDKIYFKATHSYIRNGYLENELDSKFVIASDHQANLLVENITTFGGISISNANALIRRADITATTSYALCAQEESNVVIEKSTLRKNFIGEVNAFFGVEGSKEKEISYGASNLYIGKEVQLFTTTDAMLYNASSSIAPSYATKPIIESLDVKEYLSSSLEYKCLSLCEDLVYTEEDLQEGKIIIQGKKLAIDLGGFTLCVPDSTLIISASFAQIRNGGLKVSTYDATSSIVITIEDGCTAHIDSIQTIGSIKTENASVTFKDVVINSPENIDE